MKEWRDWKVIVKMLEDGCEPQELKQYMKMHECEMCYEYADVRGSCKECPLYPTDVCKESYHIVAQWNRDGMGPRAVVIRAAKDIVAALEMIGDDWRDDLPEVEEVSE